MEQEENVQSLLKKLKELPWTWDGDPEEPHYHCYSTEDAVIGDSNNTKRIKLTLRLDFIIARLTPGDYPNCVVFPNSELEEQKTVIRELREYLEGKLCISTNLSNLLDKYFKEKEQTEEVKEDQSTNGCRLL